MKKVERTESRKVWVYEEANTESLVLKMQTVKLLTIIARGICYLGLKPYGDNVDKKDFEELIVEIRKVENQFYNKGEKR